MSYLLPRTALLCALLLAFAPRLSAAPILVDFEGIADSTSVDNLIPELTFSNAVALQAGVSLNELDFPPVSGSTVVFDAGGPMRIDFSAPIDLFSGYFTYVAPLVIQAFDSGGGLLGSVSSAFGNNTTSFGGAPNELLTLSLAGTAFVTISGDPFGGSFTLDDVSYQSVESGVAPVPEPGYGSVGGHGPRACRTKAVQHGQFDRSTLEPHAVTLG